MNDDGRFGYRKTHRIGENVGRQLVTSDTRAIAKKYLNKKTVRKILSKNLEKEKNLCKDTFENFD